MSLWFVVSLIKKRNDVADVAWGLGFVLMAWTSFYLSGDSSARGMLINILVSIWGLRLAWHIYKRNKNKPEDYRYQKWRMDWGQWFYLRSYLQVYLLQGALLFLIVLPVLMINKNFGSTLGILDFVGVAVWIFGFYFESVGDAELAKFIKNPENKGKLMQGGLWAYTRHPNYFGEVTQWWGIWLVALSIPDGMFAIIGPLTITFLILKISGIPLLEKKMEENPEFAEYKRKTSMFIPLPRKQ
jgi:steroid 5-alpha reductase family enzyme